MSGSLSESESAVTPESLTPADREAVAEIVALVANSRTQGCVYFGICNSGLKIIALEAALATQLRVHGIEIARVVLAERHDENGQPAYRVLIADPIAYFLFERKQGHCEYFASSMAVMSAVAVVLPAGMVMEPGAP